MNHQKLKKKDIVSYWDVFNSNKICRYSLHCINYKLNGELKKLKLQSNHRFLITEYWEEDA